MSRKRAFSFAFAFLMALLLAAGGAAAIGPVRAGGTHSLLVIPVAEKGVDCAKLDVTVAVGSIFDEIECSRMGSGGFGGESVQIDRAEIVAKGLLSHMFLMHDHGGPRTYMQRQTPRSLLEEGVDYDVPGSWESADSSNDFDIDTFFGKFGSAQLSCFAFVRYAGHVSHTVGYQNRVFGVYCEGLPSDTPLPAARIDEVMESIKADFF
jgi:hypothetical protein